MSRMRRVRGARLVPCVIGACLLLVLGIGCGSDDDRRTPHVSGPLPTGPDDPQAYTETFMARNPKTLAHLNQLMIVNLEATSSEQDDTCMDRPGVDCIPYLVEAPTQLELSIADEAKYLAELDLVDASGAVVLRQARGEDPHSALVEAGSYRLELHHLNLGDASAPEQAVFLRPTSPTDAATLQLTAQMNCPQCDFSGADLESQNFDGLILTGSNFNRAQVLHTTFRGAKMADCHFLDLFSLYPGGEFRGTTWEIASIDADFTGAVLTRAEFSLRAMHAPRFHFAGVFRDAKLDSSVWKGKRKNAGDFNLLFNADFRNADLTNSHWREEITVLRRTDQSKFPRCTFQGADLTGAEFSGKIGEDLNQCRFDKEPDTGRITVLQGVDLTGLNLSNTTMADADLSEATLARTNMAGTDLSRANLSHAKIPAVRWRGAVLAGAAIAGIIPATLNDLDLTNTDFTGVNFAGLDLSRTNLSQAVLDAAPRLAGAKFSDGTHGINLAGHRFAERYDVFKGAELSGADFSQTELFQADLEGAVLNNAKLVGANLNFANLRGGKLRGAILGVQPGTEARAATLHAVFMPDVDLSDADLRSVDMTGARVYSDKTQSLLVRTRLDSANFSNAVCLGAQFSGSMNDTVFVGAQLVDAVFNRATLTGAKFDDAYLHGADFSSATSVNGTVLSNAAVAAAPGTWSFMESDGTPFVFRYQATKLGALATDRSVLCPNGALGPCCPNGDLMACLSKKLKPAHDPPYPPVAPCVPRAPCYENCITPAVPSCTPRRPVSTPTPTAAR